MAQLKKQSLEWMALRGGSRHRGDFGGGKCYYLISLWKDLSGRRAGADWVQRRGKGNTIF